MGKKKSKKQPQEPLELVEEVIEIDFSGMLGQAAGLLEHAGALATLRSDPELLLAVSKEWMEMAALTHAASGGGGAHKHDDDEEDLGSSVLGFGNTEAREKAEATARERKSRG